MRLLTPGGAPAWLAPFARDVERAIREARDAPLPLPQFANAAALPPAAEWPFAIAYVADIAMVAVSTGSGWKRLDTGASL
jgi:hypothetical protein